MHFKKLEIVLEQAKLCFFLTSSISGVSTDSGRKLFLLPAANTSQICKGLCNFLHSFPESAELSLEKYSEWTLLIHNKSIHLGVI